MEWCSHSREGMALGGRPRSDTASGSIGLAVSSDSLFILTVLSGPHWTRSFVKVQGFLEPVIEGFCEYNGGGFSPKPLRPPPVRRRSHLVTRVRGYSRVLIGGPQLHGIFLLLVRPTSPSRTFIIKLILLSFRRSFVSRLSCSEAMLITWGLSPRPVTGQSIVFVLSYSL